MSNSTRNLHLPRLPRAIASAFAFSVLVASVMAAPAMARSFNSPADPGATAPVELVVGDAVDGNSWSAVSPDGNSWSAAGPDGNSWSAVGPDGNSWSDATN